MTGEGGEKRCPGRSGMTEEADKKKAGGPKRTPGRLCAIYVEFNTRDMSPEWMRLGHNYYPGDSLITKLIQGWC